MSIAVAVKTRDQIVLATDSQTSFGSRRVLPDNHQATKIRRIGSALLAATGWGVYENILDDFLRRNRGARLDDSPSIFALFNRLWKDLHERYAYVNDQCEESDSPFGNLDSTFLVANRAGLFSVEADLSVTEFERYYAIGSGASYGLGCLHALYEPTGDARAVARKAVEAAMVFDLYCGGEVCMESIRRHAPAPARKRKAPSRGKK